MNPENKKDLALKIAIAALRMVVGGVFVFSGFVKAVDPWGTVYKFIEYFGAFGLGELQPLAYIAPFILIAFEFICGVLLFFGCYRRSVVIMMLLFMGVMLSVTLYIAVADNVDDCGCFGEVVHLSNWATFWKNVVLTGALVVLLFYNRRLKNVFGAAVQWLVILLSFVYVMWVSFVGYTEQPLLDFRPFKTGSHLIDTDNNEKLPEFVFIYEKEGVQREFSVDSLPSDDWNFVERREISGEQHPSSDRLTITVDGEDVSDEVIDSEGEQIILLFPDLEDIDISYTYVINEIYDKAATSGMKVVGLTSASQEKIEEWKDLSMAAYDMYEVDDSKVKMIARGNPAIVYLRNGVIVWKNSLHSISIDSIENGPELPKFAQRDDDALMHYTLLYVGALIVLLIINRSPTLSNRLNLKFLFSLKNKKKDVNLQDKK